MGEILRRQLENDRKTPMHVKFKEHRDPSSLESIESSKLEQEEEEARRRIAIKIAVRENNSYNSSKADMSLGARYNGDSPSHSTFSYGPLKPIKPMRSSKLMHNA